MGCSGTVDDPERLIRGLELPECHFPVWPCFTRNRRLSTVDFLEPDEIARRVIKIRRAMDYSFLTIAVAIAAAQFALDYDAGRESATQRGGQFRFRAGRYFRFMSYLVLLFPLVALNDVIRHGRSASIWQDWPSFVGTMVMFLVLGYGGYPRTIVVDSAGVRLSSYLGVGGKFISWTGTHAVVDPAPGKIIVCGPNGEQIIHSKQHVGHLQFIFLLKKHIRVY